MAVGSIVDYLKKNNQDSSFGARKKLASQYGINNYSGTASQNIQLLKSLQSGANKVTAPQPSGAVEQITDNTPGYTAPGPVSITPTATKTKSYQSKFVPTELTDHYKSKMLSTDDDRPSAYESQYESTISDIIDTIRNKKKFDIKTDANYNMLYDQYKQRYEVNADKAMRDAMASANGATGGYGSSYGQIAGQQAYDNTMQGLNDQNLTLMQLAYQMYGDDIADNYKQLAAIQGEDDRLYGRHRDDVADWQTDRNYYANQYWGSFQNDRSAYENDRAFDYGVDKDTLDREDSQYQNALTLATSLAQKGQPVPSYLTEIIDRYNTAHGLSGDSAAQLQQLAAQAIAQTASKSSGRKASGSNSKSKTAPISNTETKSSSSSTPTGLAKLVDASKGKLSFENMFGTTPAGAAAFANSLSAPLNNMKNYHGTGTVADSNDRSDPSITNRNGDGWVYVDGLGKVTDEELERYIDNGTITETFNNGMYTYRYNKKNSSSKNSHYKDYGRY